MSALPDHDDVKVELHECDGASYNFIKLHVFWYHGGELRFAGPDALEERAAWIRCAQSLREYLEAHLKSDECTWEPPTAGVSCEKEPESK